MHNRSHYLNNPLVIALPYKNFKNEWSYSLTFDSPLESEKDYVIQFELTNNTGALISKIFQCDDSLDFSYLNKATTPNEIENLNLIITTDAITLEASELSDSLKQQLSAESLKINIVKASDITKLPNSYLNIDLAQDEDKNNALLVTKATVGKIIEDESDQREAMDDKLTEAVHSIAKVESIDETDSGILCINPYNVIPKT